MSPDFTRIPSPSADTVRDAGRALSDDACRELRRVLDTDPLAFDPSAGMLLHRLLSEVEYRRGLRLVAAEVEAFTHCSRDPLPQIATNLDARVAWAAGRAGAWLTEREARYLLDVARDAADDGTPENYDSWKEAAGAAGKERDAVLDAASDLRAAALDLAEHLDDGGDLSPATERLLGKLQDCAAAVDKATP